MLSVLKPATASPVRSSGVVLAEGLALGEVGDGEVDELLRLLAGLRRVEDDRRLGAVDADEVADGDEQRAVGGAGGAEGRHGAVHVGGEHVEAAGGDGELLGQPVAGEADEDVVDLEALDELLAGLDGADDAQALGAGGLRLVLGRRLMRGGDQGGADHRLVAVDDDVDVLGVDDAEVDLDRVRRRRAPQRVLGELERDLRAVGGGDAEAQALEGEAHVVAVDVGEAARGGEHALVEDAARHDAELLPLRDARRRGHLLDERRRALVVAVELGEDRVGDALGQRVPGLDGLADDGGERLELAPVLDLVGAAGLRLRAGSS